MSDIILMGEWREEGGDADTNLVEVGDCVALRQQVGSLRMLTHPLANAFANLSHRIFNIWAMLALRGIAVLDLWSTICLQSLLA